MITFTRTDNGFLAAFSGNELFLDEGTISLPFNALSLTIDSSEIATFKKSSNGDVFFSGIISNIIFGETTATKENIGGLFASSCCDNGVDEELSQRVTALETTVGNSTSGLVHDVNDLDDSVSTLSSSVGALQTTVGNSTSGLVKDVDDLESTVGDNNSGLVKDVDDLNNSVSTMSSTVTSLQSTVGDNNSGLVKDVNDLETTIIDDERVTAEALTALRTMIAELDVPI